MEKEVTNKVNKVNENVVKVNVNQVKPQITFIKRKVSKFLVENKLAAAGNTTTKPEAIKLTEGNSKKVQAVITKAFGEMKTKYEHTTVDQLQYVKNHLNTHTSKYLR